MNWKLVVSIGAIVLALPTLWGFLRYASNAGHQTPDQTVQAAGDIIVEAAVPWWLQPLKWGAEHPGWAGTIVVLGLVAIIKFIPEWR